VSGLTVGETKTRLARVQDACAKIGGSCQKSPIISVCHANLQQRNTIMSFDWPDCTSNWCTPSSTVNVTFSAVILNEKLLGTNKRLVRVVELNLPKNIPKIAYDQTCVTAAILENVDRFFAYSRTVADNKF
jgi:hypothetical protein